MNLKKLKELATNALSTEVVETWLPNMESLTTKHSIQHKRLLNRMNRLYDFQDEATPETILNLIEQLEEANEVIAFYGNKDLYFDRPIKVNLQNSTAVLHVDNPEDLPTEWDTTTPEVSVKLKVDKGRKAQDYVKKYI